MQALQDVNVVSVRRLDPPVRLKERIPADGEVQRLVMETRAVIQRILLRQDGRPLVVVGPCSIHDPRSALEYAERLARLRDELRDRMEIIMRVYFEKPRTTIGWKGLIYDPHLDGSDDVSRGLELARELLVKINGLGMPAATEFLDPITPQYIADLVSWAAIGARTTESQTHRQMASGLSMPIGFKNGTDGSLQVAIDAMGAAMHAHSFLGIDMEGRTSVIKTRGNPWGHIVLRGGSKRTNYDAESIRETFQRLERAGLSPVVMVDCSHANSGKIPARQEQVWHSVIEQRAGGSTGLIGFMLESHLYEGNQPLTASPSQLKYGVSITDACLSWETTERLLRQGYARLAS